MDIVQRDTTNDNVADTIGSLLQSSSVTPAWDSSGDWEATLDKLAEQFSGRLVSTGGRPTDPEWKLSRRVPLAPSTWASLQALAAQLGGSGRSVAPAQLAAVILEERVAELDELINNRQEKHPR
jgi:hypothetical protein